MRRLLALLLLLALIAVPLNQFFPVSIEAPHKAISNAENPSRYISTTSSGHIETRNINNALLTSKQAWNESLVEYKYRIKVTVSEVSGVDRLDYLLDIYIDFHNRYNVTPHYTSFRILKKNTKEVPYQLWNITWYDENNGLISAATITIMLNLSAYQEITYYIYFDEEAKTQPTFDPIVTYTTGSAPYRFKFNGYSYYNAYTNDNKGGKLYEVYHRWYDTTEGFGADRGNGLNWNPDIRYSSWYTTSNPYHDDGEILQAGPLFITYTTNTMNFYYRSSRYPAHAVTTYRFFKWGWFVETNMTFETSFSLTGSYYWRMSEWVFEYNTFTDVIIMNDTYYYPSSSHTWYLSTANNSYYGFFNRNNGRAAGIIFLTTFHKGMTITRDLRRIFRRTSYYDFWDRQLQGSGSANSWIYEKYMIVIWNAVGNTPQEMRSIFDKLVNTYINPLSIHVSDTLEIYRKHLTLKVFDADGVPIPNANVTIWGESLEGAVTVTRYTNDSGIALFELPPIGTYNLSVEVQSWNYTYYYYDEAHYVWTSYAPEYISDSIYFDGSKGDKIHKVVFRVYDKDRISYLYKASISLNSTSLNYEANITTNELGWATVYLSEATYTLKFYYSGTQQLFRLYNASTPLGFNTTTQDLIADSVPQFNIDVNAKLDYLVELVGVGAIKLSYLDLLGGAPTQPVIWGSNITVDVWFHTSNASIDVNSDPDWWLRWSIIDADTGSVVPGFDDLEVWNEYEIGKYRITFNTSALDSEKNYLLIIKANASPDYQPPAPLQITFRVRDINTALYVIEFSSQVYYNSTFKVRVKYWNVDKDVSIGNATVKITFGDSGVEYNLTYDGQYYYLETGLTLPPGSYIATLTASKDHYRERSVSLVVEVKPRNTRLDVLYEGYKISYLEFEYKRYLRIEIVYYDVTGAEVRVQPDFVAANIITYEYSNESQEEVLLVEASLEWNSTSKSYVALFDLENINVGSYILKIYVSKTYYIGQATLIPLTIDPISTWIAVSHRNESIEWGETATFAIWYNASSGLIEDAYSKCEIYYGDILVRAGQLSFDGTKYVLSVDSKDIVNESWYKFGTYLIRVFIAKYRYQNHTLVLTLDINLVDTIGYAQPTNITCYWGDEISASLYYNRTADNNFIENATLLVQVYNESGYTLSTLAITVTRNIPYGIIINSSELEEGYYIIEINVTKKYHESQLIRIYLRILSIPTNILLSHRSIELEYVDSIEIAVYYINALVGGPVINASVYYSVYYEKTLLVTKPLYFNGEYYYFVLDPSELIELIGNATLPAAFTIEINASKPHYVSYTRSIAVTISPVACQVVASETELSVEWGEIVNIYFEIRRNKTLEPVLDLVTTIKGLPEDSYNLSIVGSKFLLTINTSRLETVQETNKSYAITVMFSKQYYSLRPVTITLTVNRVSITISLIESLPSDVKRIQLIAEKKVTPIKVLVLHNGTPVDYAEVFINVSSIEAGITRTIEAKKIDTYYEALIDWSQFPPGYNWTIIIYVNSVKINGITVTQEKLYARSVIHYVKMDYLSGTTRIGNIYIANMYFYPLVITALVVGFYALYKVVSFYTLPPEVREIIRLLNKIKKGIFEYPAPSRYEYITQLISEELQGKPKE